MHVLTNQPRQRQPGFYGSLIFLCVTAVFWGTITASANRPTERQIGNLLELRGYMRMGGQIEFSVHNKEEKRSEWLRVGEEKEGYRIESYDASTNSIFIHYRDLSGTLHLQASRIAEYVPPPPKTPPAQPDPAQRSPANASETTQNSPSPPALPPTSLPSRPERSQETSERNRPFMGSQFRAPDESGSPQPTPEEPEQAKPTDPYWTEHNTPPPLPSTLPPDYSPER